MPQKRDELEKQLRARVEVAAVEPPRTRGVYAANGT